MTVALVLLLMALTVEEEEEEREELEVAREVMCRRRLKSLGVGENDARDDILETIAMFVFSGSGLSSLTPQTEPAGPERRVRGFLLQVRLNHSGPCPGPELGAGNE